MLTNWSTTIPLHESCPAAFIIGARKGGTTSLYQYLSHHPDFEGIHLEDGPTAGETFHFSARYFTENWRLYKSRFPKLPLMTGDASVGNLVNCKVPGRIFESCGNFSKILILLRNPVNRYLSNFHMRTRLNTRQFSSNTGLTTIINLEMSSFYKSLINSGITIGVNERDTGHWSRYLCMFGPSINMLYEGLYYVHLMNWLCNYPSENILIMNSEEFYTNTTSILHQVYQFLGLSPLSEERMQLIASFVFNKGTSVMSSHQMLQETDHKKLRHFYNSFNNALTKLLQWDGITW
jgi:[heparan sulfate]-glucosamine 3-sulfotransferase 2